LSKQISKEGIDKTKQQGNKNDWKQQAPLKFNIEYKWLNAPIKRHRIANWVKKQNPTICCLQDIHLTE
jgi:hypothetical protein